MLPSLRPTLERLRRPEYTGENRCTPCTVANLLIAAGLALLAGRVRRSAGVLAFAVGAALVGLRGYLVPGTPTLTKRYAPDRLLAAFDKAPDRIGAETLGPVASPSAVSGDGGADADADVDVDRDAGVETTPAEHATAPGVDPDSHGGEASETAAETETADAPPEHATAPGVDPDSHGGEASETAAAETEPTPTVVDPERAFLDAGAVEPTPSGDDLELTAEFEAAWLEAAEELRDDRDAQTAALADLFGVDVASVSADAADDGVGVEVTVDGGRTNVWMTDGALLADAAAHRVLRERDPWPTVSVEQRLGLLRALRSFLPTCLRCGGDVSMTDEVVGSCCRQWDVLAVRCGDCDEHYLELTMADVGASGGGATGVGPTRG